jgi:hypothetical protein
LIGLEVSSEKAFNYLAERAGDQGEATQLSRRGAVLHGRCWKLGEGLEVWTVLYESGSGDLFYADCRPGFRARYIQTIAPWALTEYDEEGEAVIHGFREGTDCEVLFELQNLTEVGPAGFGAQELHIGLCGLAYRARVRRGKSKTRWMPLEKTAPARAAHENDWSLSGRVIAFKPLKIRFPAASSSGFISISNASNSKCSSIVARLRGDSLELSARRSTPKFGCRATCSTNTRCVRVTKALITPARARVSGPACEEKEIS